MQRGCVDIIMKHIPCTIVVILLSAFCGGCHSNYDNKADNATSVPVVTVSIPPQEFLLRAIVGDDLEVNTMLPPGVDAEAYEPSVQTMCKLENSMAYAMVGTLPFEEDVAPKLKNMYPGLRISDARNLLFIISEEESHHLHEQEGEHHHCHDHGEDPHVWTTPRNLKALADDLLAVAIQINPEKAQTYKKRHKALVARIDALQRRMASNLMPLSGRKVVVWHPSLAYLAHDFNFAQLPVQQGHKEPSPRQMAYAVEEANRGNAAALVVETEHSPRLAITLNRDMKLHVVKTSLMQFNIINALDSLALNLGNAAKSLQ